jgi:hypothetical protein
MKPHNTQTRELEPRVEIDQAILDFADGKWQRDNAKLNFIV